MILTSIKNNIQSFRFAQTCTSVFRTLWLFCIPIEILILALVFIGTTISLDILAFGVLLANPHQIHLSLLEVFGDHFILSSLYSDEQTGVSLSRASLQYDFHVEQLVCAS